MNDQDVMVVDDLGDASCPDGVPPGIRIPAVDATGWSEDVHADDVAATKRAACLGRTAE
ncbi:hypothetical protein OHB05_40595 [Streptomyces sp. NBC_00638]|uniref:hypothetical protein n=1 Tax=Streptomyces sp. NBC_00638 TaxID=2975794 RepID=UPI002258CFDD|nr:hypothetical protein [Streptomyces sp. NBC_00638]MCX5008827.1 hypothetical protein [Streptomyces sp. NBC_00638]